MLAPEASPTSAARARPASPAAQRRLRVLTVVDGVGTHGGAESIAAEICRRLDPERFESSFCATRPQSREEEAEAVRRFREAGVDFLSLRRRRRLDLGEWRRLLAYIREHRIDVLHTHKFGSNVWGALLARLAGVPVFVAHEHSWSFRAGLARRQLDRRLIAARADAFVAVSPEDRRKMNEVERIPEGKIRLIANGIPTAPVPSGRDLRAELGLAPESEVVGIVATLRPPKALHVFIKAIAELRRRFPLVRGVIVGGADSEIPGEAERLKALTRDLGLEGSVVFAGLRLDIPDVLASFDVAALSSDHEGGPLSVLEYMQAGKPVVATAVGGIPEIVVDGETGFLVAPHDPAALAESIGRLLASPELRARFGAAGRDRQQRLFTIERTVRAVEDLYEELASGSGGAAARAIA